jgi:ubiquitin C-terminal hydrolase
MSYDKLFRVPNIGNSCYIDSLLVALFYVPSDIRYLLTSDLTNPNGLYLQEAISKEFIDEMRAGKSIPKSTMEKIRLLCKELGWKNNNATMEIQDQQDVNEFYIFLIENLKGVQIKIQTKLIAENAIETKDDLGKESDIPYIPLSLPMEEEIKSIKVNELLSHWLTGGTKEVNRKVRNEDGSIEEKLVTALDINNITNLPQILPFVINRFQNVVDDGKFKFVRNDTNVYIQTKYCPCENAKSRRWKFHAVVCHAGNTPNSGHYYCVIVNENDEYYIFDDLRLDGCLKQVDMKNDKKTTSRIKKDCVFIILKQAF